ncbi:MAG: dinitrogenase iron-molybdenum cofactor biosynthesis protein [Deltaproteobacteria bacterium]|nr:dinitrogenase iron-molybdenum cofactor biosynthesis protein [Deltaproteobacteria bacterium]
MKIAVTSTGNQSASAMDTRFGRTRWFMVTDPEAEAWEAHANEQNMNAAQGAGIQAAQRLVNLGVEAVITGHVGPKAFRILKAAGIGIFFCEGGTVEESLRLYKEDRLSQADQADVEGHWA